MIGDKSESLEAYLNSLAIRQKLVDENPADDEHLRNRLASDYMSLGWLLWETIKPAQAEDASRKAMVILQKLADDNPTDNDVRMRLAANHKLLGIWLAETSRPTEAVTEYRQARWSLGN